MTVKLASKLPKDAQANGLDAVEARLLSRPMEQVVAICYLGVQKIVTDYEEGGRQPIVMVEAIEVVGDVADMPDAVRAVFEAIHTSRVDHSPTLPEPVEFAPCEDCGHTRDQHSDSGICNGLDANEDACECNEYLALCSCGHPWGLHDMDEGNCAVEVTDEAQCRCLIFEPSQAVEAVEAVIASVLFESYTDDDVARGAELLHAAGLTLVPPVAEAV